MGRPVDIVRHFRLLIVHRLPFLRGLLLVTAAAENGGHPKIKRSRRGILITTSIGMWNIWRPYRDVRSELFSEGVEIRRVVFECF